jgi:hypothetical protein
MTHRSRHRLRGAFNISEQRGREAVVIYESNLAATGSAMRLAADDRRALEASVDSSGRRLQIIHG